MSAPANSNSSTTPEKPCSMASWSGVCIRWNKDDGLYTLEQRWRSVYAGTKMAVCRRWNKDPGLYTLAQRWRSVYAGTKMAICIRRNKDGGLYTLEQRWRQWRTVFNGRSQHIHSDLEFRGEEVKIFGHHHKERPTDFLIQPRNVLNEINNLCRRQIYTISKSVLKIEYSYFITVCCLVGLHIIFNTIHNSI